ncbi:HAMP domain-containing sensor histidine kinase [Methylobacterium sp. B4]|uniref:sensor histidine kinase n=1 Tax=Methylobacterium sp. B4 TaxID=1938755 RepID=UPI000D763D54|nr:HAMP domain-containing sensor histidine kinase [Methylobacterium sp. B4]PXW63735.1 histidine kinase/DNA gyrase B/HSP90-like ATPase [Methylobacterium sp. B4]
MHKLLIQLGLRFDDPDEERSFVRSFTLHDLGRTQAAMVLGAFVYCSFSGMDWILSPDAWAVATALRLAVALLVLLPATLLLTRPGARPFAEQIYLVYCVVPGCVLSLIYVFLRPSFDHGAAGLIIVILFVSTLLPLRVTSFAVFAVLTWTCFALFETIATHENPGLALVNNAEIGAAYALSLYGVGAREYRARRQFRTARALQAEKERSEKALSDLRSAQTHLVQAEKLAALGQLVAGVAHEINTPIGLALTTSTAFDHTLAQLRRSAASGQIRRSQLTQSVDRLGEGATLIVANLQRAADLVHNFKQVAVDQATEDRRRFELRPWFAELLSTLDPVMRRKGHEVRLDCADGIILDSYPGALAQVVSNLALNAMIHAFPEGRAGRLAIDVTQVEEARVRIVFQDDGKGVPRENLQRIFDPFFTTGRDKGSTGLGLHIVYNLVVSTLGGQIALESEENVGTRVTIELPLTLPAPAPHGNGVLVPGT